jgi:hypothetical protein
MMTYFLNSRVVKDARIPFLQSLDQDFVENCRGVINQKTALLNTVFGIWRLHAQPFGSVAHYSISKSDMVLLEWVIAREGRNTGAWEQFWDHYKSLRREQIVAGSDCPPPPPETAPWAAVIFYDLMDLLPSQERDLLAGTLLHVSSAYLQEDAPATWHPNSNN